MIFIMSILSFLGVVALGYVFIKGLKQIKKYKDESNLWKIEHAKKLTELKTDMKWVKDSIKLNYHNTPHERETEIGFVERELLRKEGDSTFYKVKK